MSIALEEALKPAAAAKALTDVHFTICPVFNASNIAVELGWLDEEFQRAGANGIYLRSLANGAGFLPHFTHSLPNLFRDGGAIPTIQSKADRTDTTLIGLTWGQRGGQILVRSRSGIRRVADLKGRKIGLYHSLNRNKIDFHRATGHRGIVLALELAGLSEKDVEIVNLDDENNPKWAPARKPSELWQRNRAHRAPLQDEEAVALREGHVDAIHAGPSLADVLLSTGEFTSIEDLGARPDWTLQVANGPYTIAVNTAFAEEHPEVIVAFLRASIRAGRWANANKAAAAAIFTRVTQSENAALIERLLDGVDLVPNLSAKNLAAIDIQKKFLRDHGYVKNDFDVNDWADSSYLEKALRSL